MNSLLITLRLSMMRYIDAGDICSILTICSSIYFVHEFAGCLNWCQNDIKLTIKRRCFTSLLVYALYDCKIGTRRLVWTI